MSKRSITGNTLDIANECRPDVKRWAKRLLLSILAVSSFEQCDEDRFLPLRLVFCFVRVLFEGFRLLLPTPPPRPPDDRPPRPRPRPLPDEESPGCLPPLPGPRPRPVLPPLSLGWMTAATDDGSSAFIAWQRSASEQVSASASSLLSVVLGENSSVTWLPTPSSTSLPVCIYLRALHPPPARSTNTPG